jgi:hypothetical protein
MALTNAERQARWRERRNALAKEALRNEGQPAPLRNEGQLPKWAREAVARWAAESRSKVQAFCEKYDIPEQEWRQLTRHLPGYFQSAWAVEADDDPIGTAEDLCELFGDVAEGVAYAMLDRPWGDDEVDVT